MKESSGRGSGSDGDVVVVSPLAMVNGGIAKNLVVVVVS